MKKECIGSFGRFLSNEISARGWSQKDLAEITGMAEGTISKIINDGASVVDDNICAIAYAFDMTPEFLKNLEFRFKLKELPEDESKEFIRLKAECKDILPLSEMAKKGWVRTCESAEDIKETLLGLFGTDSVDELKEPRPLFAARKTRYDERLTVPYCNAWFNYAKQIAIKHLPNNTYNRGELEDLSKRICAYTMQDNGIAEFLSDLESCGVGFFVLEHLQKTYLDGAAFIIEGRPFIIYTGRYDRIDNFWFVISHEIAHVLLHYDILEKGIIDISLDEKGEGDIEIEADKFAEEILHKKEVVSAARKLGASYFSVQKVSQLSERFCIPSSMIMGFLAHDKIVEYRTASRYINKKVLQKIPRKYLPGKVAS